MRNFLTGVVIVLLAAVCQATPTVLRDPGDAWPWGAELPFPWRGIQGTWMTTINGEDTFFKFVTVRSSGGFNQLQVTEYRGSSCEVIAHGAGYEQNRVVKAVMISAAGTFNLTVHVFREEDVRDARAADCEQSNRTPKTVTVMNVSPMGSGTETRMTYRLYKIDSDPQGPCVK